MVVDGSRRLLSGIPSTHVGHPLPHCREGFLHSISSYRFAGGARSLAVSGGEGDEVAELFFLAQDSIEGVGVPEVVTEFDPLCVHGAFGSDVLGGSRCAGLLERRAEIRLEVASLGRVTSCQGRDCGYSCWK